MDPKCLLTSTDLQTRRARCQHQLSFLLCHVTLNLTKTSVVPFKKNFLLISMKFGTSMSDARRYAVWPEPRSVSRSLKGSRPSVPHGTNFLLLSAILNCKCYGYNTAKCLYQKNNFINVLCEFRAASLGHNSSWMQLESAAGSDW